MDEVKIFKLEKLGNGLYKPIIPAPIIDYDNPTDEDIEWLLKEQSKKQNTIKPEAILPVSKANNRKTSDNMLMHKVVPEIDPNLHKLIDKNGYLVNNTLFYGLSGSGKYTNAIMMLHKIYGDIVFNRKIEVKQMDKKSIKYIYNPYYYEILINNYVFNDLDTLLMFLKTLNKRIDGRCHYIIIKNIDELSIKSQNMLLNVLKFNFIRIITTAKNLNKVSTNVKSRFYLIRTPRPDKTKLIKILSKMSKQENYKVTPLQLENIVKQSNCDQTIALNMLHKANINTERTFMKYRDVHNKYIADILGLATMPCIENIREIRKLISQLIVTTYDMNDVYTVSLKLFYGSKYDINMKHKVIDIAAKYSALNQLSLNLVYISEAFFLEIMRIVNQTTTKSSK